MTSCISSSLPRVASAGEQVPPISPSGQLSHGVVLNGLFSDQISANGDRPNLHRHTYHDGTVLEYDSEAHHLRAILTK